MTRDDIEAQTRQLATGDVSAKSLAIDALREAPLDSLGADAIATIAEALAGALGDSESLIRGKAAEALGEQPFIPWQVRLIELLQADVDAVVRVSAAEALGDAGNTGGIDALESALDDADAVVRGYAATSLGLLGSMRSFKLLRDRAFTEQSTSRFDLLGAIARLTQADADVAALLAALDEGPEEDMFRALNVLEDLLRRKTPSPLTGGKVRPLFERLRNRLSQLHHGHLARLSRLLESD